jgi:TolB-like protein/DNA-binding winged helix-turn-helix (wHTH) protein
MGGPIVFGPYVFDPEARELRRNGNTVRLQDQPAQVLGALLERHGHVVTREELQHLLWSDGTFVDYDQSLNRAVTRLRSVLDDDADHPCYIETIPRRGYRFIAPITKPEPAPAPVSVPAPPRRFALVGVALSLAAVAAVSLWLFLANRPAPIASIAVLPFENLTGDPQHEPEADALTEALISRLSQVSSFQRVISRTSVVQYKGTKKPLPEIAKALRVDAIVEGALLQSGDRVKATVRLIHAPRERPIWSQSYDHPARGVIDLQSEMALDLVAKARAALTNQELSLIKSSRSVDPEAYRQFLLGRHLCRQWKPEALEKGRTHLQAAVAKDPMYAEAHAALGGCTSGPSSKFHIEQALAIDPSNARAYSARGMQRLVSEWRWEDAEADFLKAIELAPLSDEAHFWYVMHLVAMTRYDEALREVDRSIDLNPADFLNQQMGSWAANKARRWELALQYSRRSHELNLGSDVPFVQECFTLTQLGRIAEAKVPCERVMQQYPLGKWDTSDIWVIQYLVAAGRRPEAEAALRHWLSVPTDLVDPSNLASMLAALGYTDRALDRLDDAYARQTASMFLMKAENTMDSIRHHPRYLAILKKMNFPE